jgi:hypothetical protein
VKEFAAKIGVSELARVISGEVVFASAAPLAAS